ncbi:MAG TPA: hypothetical protein VMF69_17850 [Gemmataceae bacterium]|nr:hypothetical protein [Gemmataceae bacterium]
MNRSLCALAALLLACAVAILAAPAPQPFVSGWGSSVDPDKDCKIRRDKGSLTIEMPGTVHYYDPLRKRFNAPRLLRDFEGDFEMQLRVRIDCRPSVQSSVKDQLSYVCAGFLVIPPDTNGIATDRLEYRVAGQGDEVDGCAAMLQSGNKRGQDFGALNKQNHPLWPFKSKPDHVYLRLVRLEEVWSSDISADGEKWLSFGGGGVHVGLPSKLTVGLAACTTSTEPSKVVFDQLTIRHGEKKREPWEFVSGWGKPIDPDKDCKIQRDKDALTIEMPGTDHDYDPVRERLNAPRLFSELEGEFDVQVRVRIDSRPSAPSTVKGQPSFVSAGFLLIYPEEGEYSVCDRLEYAVSQQGSIPDAFAVAPRLAEPRRKSLAPKEKGADSYAVMKTWIGTHRRKGNRIEWNHREPIQYSNQIWERGWQKWSLPEKAEYAYLRLEQREGVAIFFISPDGEKWTRLDYLPHVLAKCNVGLAAFSTSPEPSKVCFDQLKLWRGKKKE